jgi:hypothetical protein
MNKLIVKLALYGLKRKLRRQPLTPRPLTALAGVGLVGLGAAAMYLLGPKREGEARTGTDGHDRY